MVEITQEKQFTSFISIMVPSNYKISELLGLKLMPRVSKNEDQLYRGYLKKMLQLRFLIQRQ